MDARHPPDCLFCRIAAGAAPCHPIWEDAHHLAFLSLFPNTAGASVVITKAHYPSYFADLPDEVLHGLMGAVRTVAQRLDARLADVGRTGVIFEGFGVDHIHAKLFPMHGTRAATWQRRPSNVRRYFDRYEGYLSSHDHTRADEAELAALARLIRGE